MQIQFSTMQSLGNDFMIVNHEVYPLQLSAEIVRRLSNRTSGVGFDQILIVERDANEAADIFCRIYNADGSQVMQCGNGIRCVARYALDHSLVQSETKSLTVRTDERVTELSLYG